MKLFVTDLDGTLLDCNDNVSNKNQEALLELSKRNYQIVLASGRQLLDTTSLSLGDIHTYKILLNGALLYDDKNNLIYDASLPYEKVISIMTYCNHHNLMYLIYTKDTRYVSLPNNLIQQLYDIAKTRGDDENIIVDGMQMLYEMYAKYAPYTKEIASRFQQGDEAIYKIEVMHASSEVLTTFEASLANDISVSSSWPTNREITALHVNKGATLEKLCTYLNLSPQQCIAIGDSRNDMEMMSYAGYSIAMGNAKQEIKDLCDYVTTTCEEHGVSAAINHIIKTI